MEFKSTISNKPYENHILQLASYCQLIEENFNSFVPYGIIVYNNQYDFKIPYNPQLRYELENVIKEMRTYLKKGKALRNHNDSARCRNCSMQNNCNQKLL